MATSSGGNAETYDEDYYEHLSAITVQSARIYLIYLWRLIQPASVVDVGCGRGVWLKACHELGCKSLLGLDGDWNSQSLMVDQAIEFQTIDLNKPFHVDSKRDLAISLEVAEHLEPSSARDFVKCLTDAADAVLFSAAYSLQGGAYHINEQPHSYWAQLFAEHAFAPFDLFRPVFWDNENVCWWYRQNTFLYLKRESQIWRHFESRGCHEISNMSFMDCIHPVLFDKLAHRSPRLGLRDILKALPRSFVQAARRRLRSRARAAS